MPDKKQNILWKKYLQRKKLSYKQNTSKHFKSVSHISFLSEQLGGKQCTKYP